TGRGEPGEHGAMVLDRALRWAGRGRACEPQPVGVEDREISAQRPRDRGDQLVELTGGHQTSELDPIVERAHPVILPGSGTPTWSARALWKLAASIPRRSDNWRSASRTAQAHPTSAKNVSTTPIPRLALASWIAAAPNRSSPASGIASGRSRLLYCTTTGTASSESALRLPSRLVHDWRLASP